MADNQTRGRSADRKRLNKSEPYEVAYAKSDRASPERKAMLAKSEAKTAGRSAGNGASRAASAKRAGSGAKKTASAGRKSTSGASKSSASGARKSSSSGARKSSSSGARKSSASAAGKASGARKPVSSGARKTSSARGSARSASPAMKRTNATPARRPAQSTRGTPHPPKEERTVENTAPKTMREPDAVDLLTDDHLEVSSLFKRYEKLADKKGAAEQRRELATQICEMLKAHTRIEEEIFYPAARGAGVDADKLDEAKVEHASAKDLIAQVEAGNPDDDLYDAKMTVLREYIQHHVVEEHTEMFPQCRRKGMDLIGLRAELEARKASILPGSASPTQDDGTKEEPGLLSRLSGKLFSSDEPSAGSSSR